MVVSRLSGISPGGAVQEVVVVELLGGQQFRKLRLSTAQALDEPEVSEARQPWGLDDQESGSVGRRSRKCVGHIGWDYHQVSFAGRDYLIPSQQLQLPIQQVEEFG